jgi:hypothetical protein
MNYIKSILFVSFLFTAYTYSSSYSRIELPIDTWLQMSRLTISYNQSIEAFKQGDTALNFQEIFNDMESLAQRLPEENGVQKHYQLLIQNRREYIAQLNNSNS